MTSRAEHRHPELEQRCAWCKAAKSEPCTNQRNEPRTKSHPTRIDAWVVAHTDCPTCQAPPSTECHDDGRPRAGAHQPRTQAALDAYAKSVEDASRDVNGRNR
ncbi:hypothetical protein [Streptomyces sp. NPDC005302]|uniref:zinc finger domain-containing protein n=1 Tax=Streptomyces sp. NPDC005302 TaxID=3154675 RepID=UPI00339DDB7F